MSTIATPIPIPAFAPVLKPLDATGWEVPVCEGKAEDFVSDMDEVGDVVWVELEEEKEEEDVAVTAADPTLKVVERRLGAGSSNIRFVGELQFTVVLSDSVPQHAQVCVVLS
jgi:hypothetical protein